MRSHTRRSPIFRKYLLAFVAPVSGALLAIGLITAYFLYQENATALARIQGAKAVAAAQAIKGFLTEIESQIRAANPQYLSAIPDSLDQREIEYRRLLRLAPAIMQIQYLDSSGREQLLVSRMGLNRLQGGQDYSEEEGFLRAQPGQPHFGPVDYRSGSEPYIRIAVRETGPLAGVSTAEVNLKMMGDVVRGVDAGRSGYAYVVDRDGKLIAHREISLVLQRLDFSTLPQVHGVLTNPDNLPAHSPRPILGLDIRDQEVLTVHAATVAGWWVFVEQPSAEAFAPLDSALLRTVGVLLLGLLFSVLAIWALARKMVTPIQALQTGAERIGAGALDQRIEVRTGDELEALADEFNLMATRLRESYAGLEQQVDERTRDLADALQEIEQKNRQLEVANRGKDEFMADMAHDLRTPLNSIIGFSESLLERMAGQLNAKQDEYLHHILGSGRHLLALIERIIDPEKKLDLSHFWLPAALQEALNMVRAEASRQATELTLNVHPDLGVIEADEHKVIEVLSILLSNAVKFTSGGQVRVVATTAEGTVRISVADTGCGIPAEERESIFERGTRGTAGQAANKGSGLGLAIARQFVELHGGRIWVDSTEGEGSTFTFTLPAERVQMQHPDPEPTTALLGRSSAGRPHA